MVECRVGLGCFNTDRLGDALGKVIADAVELDDDVVVDDGAHDVGILEAHRVHNELLLRGHERVPEQAWLGPDILEGRAHGTKQLSARCATGSSEEALTNGLIGLFRGAVIQRVWSVGVRVEGDEHLASAVAVVVMNGDARAVDGNLFKIRAAMSVELSVQVGEEAALEERILREVDTSNDVAGLELRWSADIKWY